MNLDESKLSLTRKYFHEVVLFGLTTCVIYLFFAYKDVNNYIRDNLTMQNVNTVSAIKENTDALRRTNNILLQLSPKSAKE